MHGLRTSTRLPRNANPGVSLGVGTSSPSAGLTSAYGALPWRHPRERTMILSVLDSKGASVGLQRPTRPPRLTNDATSRYVMTNILAAIHVPTRNPWWVISDPRRQDRATGNPQDGHERSGRRSLCVGLRGRPADPQPGSRAGVWAATSDHTAVMSSCPELAAPLWHAFMQSVTAARPWRHSSSRPASPPRPSTHSAACFQGRTRRRPTARSSSRARSDAGDNTKVRWTSIRTPTLWTPDCAGTKETKGLPRPDQVDASNANFQKYDDIWIATAKRVLGARGGPNGSPTNYFYEAGSTRPTGLSWGAPFAPRRVALRRHTPPSPSDSASPSVGPSVSRGAGALAPASPQPRQTGDHGRSPIASTCTRGPDCLAPMGLLGLIGKLRARQASRVGARGRHSRH